MVIEETLKRLDVPRDVPRLNSSHTQTSIREFSESMSSTTDDSSSPPNIPYGSVPRNTEVGEVDTAEDAIDGMGAIKFTDEEDFGYFGNYFTYFIILSITNWQFYLTNTLLKVHHQTLPS